MDDTKVAAALILMGFEYNGAFDVFNGPYEITVQLDTSNQLDMILNPNWTGIHKYDPNKKIISTNSIPRHKLFTLLNKKLKIGKSFNEEN